MNKGWVDNEFQTLDLGDQRLNKRLNAICDSFADAPLSPINQACGQWSETKAAYRFFQNDNVDYKEITKSHANAVHLRCESEPIILALQDTTYLTYSHPKTSGLCSLTKNRGKNKPEIHTLGLIMHSTLAVTCTGLPLGVCNQKIYSRPQVSEEKKLLKKRSHNAALPTKDKDTYRWIEALEQTIKTFPEKGESIITICDREADMYDLFLKAHDLNTHLLVRACQNRTVNKKSTYSEKTGEKLWDLLKKQKSETTITIDVPKRNTIPARKATCEIRYCNYLLNPPKNHFENKTKELPKLKLYAVYVSEVGSENDSDTIDWMLLTTLPVLSIEEALEKIKWYCLRWRIETWHKVLKSGLRVEDCRLATAERLIRYLAVMSIVAWRIFWITLISRIAPNESCYLFLNDIEWKILFRKFNKNKKLPNKEPSIKQTVHWIARLGGFLARKNDGEPGIIYMWRGLKCFSTMVDTIMDVQDIYG